MNWVFLQLTADLRSVLDHVNDLLETEQTFKEQYNVDRNDGKVGKLYGFDIYEFGANPTYSTAGKKNALGAAPKLASSSARSHSTCLVCSRLLVALKMYYSAAENDPQQQRNLISYRHYFICLPKKEDAGGVIRSGYNAG